MKQKCEIETRRYTKPQNRDEGIKLKYKSGKQKRMCIVRAERSEGCWNEFLHITPILNNNQVNYITNSHFIQIFILYERQLPNYEWPHSLA